MRTPGSGRKPGTLNKDHKSLLDRAEALGVDPFEILLLTVKGDWEALGLKPVEHTRTREDGTIEVVSKTDPEIPFDQRLMAAKEACQYLHSKRASVKVSADEESGFKIVIEDYSSRGK